MKRLLINIGIGLGVILSVGVVIYLMYTYKIIAIIASFITGCWFVGSTITEVKKENEKQNDC